MTNFEGGTMKKEENRKVNLGKLINYMKFSQQFKDKSDKEKKFMICQSMNVELVELFITNDKDKIDCYRYIFQNNPEEFQNTLYELLMKTSDDMIKYNYVRWLNDEIKRKNVILSIADLFTSGLALECLNSDNQKEIISKITDDEVLSRIYFRTHNVTVLCAISDDWLKEINMNNLNILDQVRVICSFEINEKKYQYSKVPVFQSYLSEITKSIKTLQYKKDIFREHRDLEFKLDVINCTDDLSEFNELVNLLPNSVYKELFYLSRWQNKNAILKQFNIAKNHLDSNPDLTFRVSFDIDTRQVNELENFERIFYNWSIEKDPYFPNVCQITSPKLDYTIDGFKELKYVCDLLNRYNCQVLFGKNMSIKFGLEYFKSLDELGNFIKLFTCSEDVLKRLCNRAGYIDTNNGILPFHFLLRFLISKNIKISPDWNINDFIWKVNMTTDSNNYSLNFASDNMLEIKMANSELEFEELKTTIILFAKLMEKVKLVTILSKKSDAMDAADKKAVLQANRELLINGFNEKINILELIGMLTNECINQVGIEFMNILDEEHSYDEQLELLLNFLFNNEYEREVYRNRYFANTCNNPYYRTRRK